VEFFFQIEWVFGGIAKFNYCVYSIRQVLNKPRVYNLIIFYPAFSLRSPGPECLCIFIPQGYLFMLQSFTTLRWKFSINIWVSMQMFDNRSVTHGGFAINAQWRFTFRVYLKQINLFLIALHRKTTRLKQNFFYSRKSYHRRIPFDILLSERKLLLTLAVIIFLLFWQRQQKYLHASGFASQECLLFDMESYYYFS
jgi:hypothetical protein